ncbi:MULTISPECIES: hypothetical protein [Chromobacterium]|uniref:Uncharacterized protein n=1 Tax=Chromobacterium fluminis TaxID=3044269 RepID=A0ABX0LGM1_9NEIS|nr:MULTISPECIES: hypothetical protein [Chromobacterium]MCP1290337.1 hypothetical protein [Chromobacterium sp. S0633]NHR08796.1 hypothetical protein [Chromobacterium haemolyticum]PTU65940.1 hypothetical protein DB032_13890 [Chromobacterium sp. Panama]UJB29603.1 hypothetical protein HQN78_06635 [Chromobacterium sp. Beijing]
MKEEQRQGEAAAGRKRGRPSTGLAMSGAERQRKYRANTVTVTLNDKEWAHLTNMLEQALKADPSRYGESDFALARKIYSAAIKGNPPPDCFHKPATKRQNET